MSSKEKFIIAISDGYTRDFKTFRFTDNIIECEGTPRPLFRNDAGYRAEIRNNRLINASDADRLENPLSGAPQGLESPLRFTCGVHGEFTVNGWDLRPTAELKPAAEQDGPGITPPVF